MGNSLSNDKFVVKGRTVAITGGSRGMGLAAGHQLAAKGANIIIIARDREKLAQGVEHIRQGALDPSTQRFHHISADLTSSSECVRVIDEIVSWNLGNPPDVVWCCAGSPHPTLFIDTPVSELEAVMNSNYFTSLYMAHAILSHWLRTSREHTTQPSRTPSSTNTSTISAPPRHLIFTASFLAFYTFTGYSPYSPAKAALRSLSDSLSQEMNLYAAAHPNEPPIRIHTIFPAGILTESYEAENLYKSDVTKMLEGADEAQTPEAVAAKSIRALESGQELITTDILTSLVKRSMLGGSVRGGFARALGDWVLACVVTLAMVFVRHDMDRKVRDWGRKFGASGMNREDKQA